MNKNLIVTCALPYANGPIHLGHMVEHIQADIWVRFHKMQVPLNSPSNCYFICADDTHGTPIMLNAEKLGITPEQLITEVYHEHLADFNAFNISFDHYYTTNSAESKQLVYDIYAKLKQNNKISTKIINQLFDEQKQMFLPDRFVKGTCPTCKTEDQYGDNCEVCGATYSPHELIDPYSVVSGTKPILKDSEHYFFKLSECTEFLTDWLNSDQRLQPEARNKMQEWLNSGLQDWDISRDKPYFGFPIPDNPDKYFYVWLDAPVGYLSSFLNFCKKNDLDFDAIWHSKDTELYHFIGKDILYFHALFWPSVLNYAGYTTPKSVFAHGFLTINGQKMSKSRGTFISAKNYRQTGISPDFFRYYIASKLSKKIEDMDFVLDDFAAKINAELVGKFINIASRSSSFMHKYFANKLSETITNTSLLKKLIKAKTEIAAYYLDREYTRALKLIMQLTDEVNAYIDEVKPWVLAKDANQIPTLHEVCSILINAFRVLSVYLKPVIPTIITQIEGLLNIPPLVWQDVDNLLFNHQIKPYSHIITRIEADMLEQLVTTEAVNPTKQQTINNEQSYEELSPIINIADFSKLDLRIAKIIDAKHVAGADKLIQLTLDIGFETRNVFAGIKSAYNPEDLIGKHTVMVANLAPRKMKFGLSCGMVLAASFAEKNGGLYILEPHSGAKPGMRVH